MFDRQLRIYRDEDATDDEPAIWYVSTEAGEWDLDCGDWGDTLDSFLQGADEAIIRVTSFPRPDAESFPLRVVHSSSAIPARYGWRPSRPVAPAMSGRYICYGAWVKAMLHPVVDAIYVSEV